jgi:hypothetical protein
MPTQFTNGIRLEAAQDAFWAHCSPTGPKRRQRRLTL